MDSFIIKNDVWLRYLPIILYGLIIVLAALSVAIAFLIYRKYKNQNLKSRNRKSPFASAYAEVSSQNAVSTAPRRRNAPPPEEEAPMPPAAAPHPAEAHGAAVIEFYFEYEDAYRI